MRRLFFIEKKSEYANAARRLYRSVTETLDMHTVTGVRILRCLMFDGWNEETDSLVPPSFFYDTHTERIVPENTLQAFAALPEYACICVIPLFRRPAEQLTEKSLRMMLAGVPETEEVFGDEILSGENRIWFRQADVFIISGLDTDDPEKNALQREKLKGLLINPASTAELPLFTTGTQPPQAKLPDEGFFPIAGFRGMTDEELLQFAAEQRYRMSPEDLRFVKSYFRVEEKRDPSFLELRMIDTFWSDHCRHITFLTALQDVEIADREIAETFEMYLDTREFLYGTRPKTISLMDIANVPAKYMIREGRLSHYVETGEKNAFTVRADVRGEYGTVPWLIHFKNETHNYSTEQEPYLGAFSSFGATIADPLSARAEVFCAMRLSGLGGGGHDRGKIDAGIAVSQQRMATETADGFAAFGVQSGIPTGYIREWMHEDFSAKHMEVCFAAAAAPESDCYRMPEPGDVIMLVGAKTGRDGLGGGLHASAVRTGDGDRRMADMRRNRTYTSQIGDPQASRALLRMMRREDVRQIVRRASDIGSGGLAIAAAELAPGVRIDLDRVPTSLSDRIAVGCMMTPHEIAFSETQARMLLVLPATEAALLARIAAEEDLDASMIGVVTSERRCRLLWWERTILSLSRDFLDATGAERRVSAYIPPADTESMYRGISDHLSGEDFGELWLRLMMHPEVASQSALAQRFDATAGGRTVLMPHGGRRMLTPTGYMAVRFPTLSAGYGDTRTVFVASAGYSARHAKQSPYHGAYLAVLESVCRLAAAGIARRDMALSLQEYFPKTSDNPVRFGIPLAAMLGAFRAQMDYSVAAVGGKDSMNGTAEAEDGMVRDVPPTVISFAVSTAEQDTLVTSAFKKAGSRVYLLSPVYGETALPDPTEEKNLLQYLYSLHRDGKVLSCMTVGVGGIAAAVAMMCFGNDIGFNFESRSPSRILFEDRPGAFLVETDEILRGTLLGYTKEVPNILIGSLTIPLKLLSAAWSKPQEKLYGDLSDDRMSGIVAAFPKKTHSIEFPTVSIPHPKVLLPVLPYQTGEDVLASHFAAVGIEPVKVLFATRTPRDIRASLLALSEALEKRDVGILAFAGGSYPGYGSVPAAISDPAARFAQAVFTNPAVYESLLTFCERESHLILGLGEGFRMLLASGVFYGDGQTPVSDRISVTENPGGHLISRMLRVRTMSVSSPWMRYAESGDIHTFPAASKAGRCIIPGELILDMGRRGEIAAQYVDGDGNPTMDVRYNPFCSDFAVEGIFARDGRIFGRMTHCDRVDNSLCINVPGNKDQGIFRAAADYFRVK